ncbi:hypothetical protein O7635_08080 [Asanoa sp. WMMD1127]|uniref:hypothetical protein n=1 Tax=Asanoa sp. WMMD1127 TaxID=3016107 RepID=UPI0024165CE2|nr:hypothetical protein [Asanoa sp. WMMD1127]MDG4821810.1 hypothetical protein [Asanoa sp. WMMD1127]
MPDAVAGDPFRDLRALIETLPVPSAPPTYTQREAALGLALMDLSLRLDHVPRVAEHLTLIDRGHMTRSVSVDVDLQAIAGAQRRRIVAPTEAGHGTSLWIPVSRYSRSDLAPVVVKDSTGAVVPRFTHRDSNRVTAAAFVRLLSMLIDAHRDVTIRDTVVHRLRHTHQRSRWLVEAAIAELVSAGSLPERGIRTPLDYALLPPRAPGDREVDARAVRDLALAGLDELWPADGRSGTRLPFAHLLSLACSQYMLIVLLDAATPRRYLVWDAPLLPGRRPSAPWQRFVQSVLPVNREFVVEYETAIPRAVGAYHLTVEVNEEVSVRRFVMSSDVDDDFVQTLTQDVEMLAEASAGQAPHRKLLELELQGIASRLAEVGRRRLTDLTSYRRYIAERHRSLGAVAPRVDPPAMDSDEVVAALGRGDCSVPVLAAFAAHYSADGLRHLARSPLAGPALPALADGIRRFQLGHDITTDNDPREHGAHAHWRRPNIDLSPHSTEPVRAVAYLSLADEAPALIEAITRVVAGLALVVLGIGTLLTGGPQWLYSGEIRSGSIPEQADAVVAVLLLVPGLLIARLDLPSTHSVLGQLRQFQRSLAIASVVVTTGLAIAAGAVHTDHAITRAFQLGMAVLGLILLCCLLEFVSRRARRRSPVPRSARLPRWLRATERRQRRTYAPDAVFDARGEV